MSEEKEKRSIHNTFEGGQVNDVDLSKRANNSFISATNVRVYQDRNGFVVTNIKGNYYSEADNVGFKITEGFIPLGGCEIDNILYIISASEKWVNDDEDGHYGEIGCFPSWSAHDGTGTLEKVYRPLQNFYSGDPEALGDFRTTKFMFSLDHMIDCFAWRLVDGSHNVYFTDNHNPIRVINNGFKANGNTNNVTYKDLYFPNAVSLILSGNKTMTIGTPLVEQGGKLNGGNYFFFFRYANYQLNPTHFLAESRPVQIFNGQSTVQHAEGTFSSSGKKVTFTLSNIDHSYKYVQVAFIRYYSDEVGAPLFEASLVNTDYTIVDGQDTLEILITGVEGERVITMDEILTNRLEDDICKTIVPIENLMWGANWKSANIHHDSMVTFSQLITVTYDDSTKMEGAGWTGSDIIEHGEKDATDSDLYKTNCGYKDYYRTANDVGYFRGETYPFSVRFELNSGHLSAAYPIYGIDEWYGRALGHTENTKGAYRFPTHLVTPTMVEEAADDWKIKILKAKFNMKAAVAGALADNSEDGLGWIKRNVRSIHLMRGERYKTLEFQGIALNGASPQTDKQDNVDLTKDCSLYPEFEGTPLQTLGSTDGSFLANDQNDRNSSLWEQVHGRYTRWLNCDDSPFWGSETRQGLFEGELLEMLFVDIEENIQREETFFPYYRGYAPMLFKDKEEAEDSDDDENKAMVKNYMSRFFLSPKHLAVFSPDFMFSSLADISKIEKIQSIEKTIPTTGDPYVDGTSKGKWYHDNLEAISGGSELEWSDIYPRWSLAEQLGFVYGSPRGYSTDFTKHAVGDEVEHHPQNSVSGFINKTKDFFQSDVESIFFMTAKKEKYVWTTRAAETPKYIGIRFDEAPSIAMNLDIVNLYNIQQPQLLTIDTCFNPSYTPYSQIRDPLLLSWSETMLDDFDWENIIVGGGDCFLQRTYFKVNGWDGTSLWDVGWENLDPHSETATDLPFNTARKNGVTRVRFTHGVVMGIVTENAFNTAMRSQIKGQSYYPRIGYKDLAVRSSEPDRKESFYLNRGYNQMLSPRLTLGYDPKFVIEDRVRQNRIRFSEVNDSTSLIDGFRSWKSSNKRDYSTSDGPINQLMEKGGFLISVCEKAINQHYINEKQLKTDPNAPDLVFGRGDILSDKVRQLADYGTQHQWSVVKGENLYGVDFIKRKIWVVGSANTGGYTVVAAEDLSAKQMFESYIEEMFEEWENNSTREYVFSDSPLTKEGIIGIYNQKEKEIVFAIVMQGEVNILDFDTWNPTETL